MLKLEFFVKHLYFPDLDSLTWTLDYSKLSDFDDSCGYWYIVPHPEKPGWTRIFYSVEVGMYDWVPKFVTDFMSNKALTDATGWLKKYSEIEALKQHSASSSTTSDDCDSNDDEKVGNNTCKKKGNKGKKIRGFFRNMLYQDSFGLGNGGDNKDRAGGKVKIEGEEGDGSQTIVVSWIRFILLVTIVVLSFYNIYLFVKMMARAY